MESRCKLRHLRRTALLGMTQDCIAAVSVGGRTTSDRSTRGKEKTDGNTLRAVLETQGPGPLKPDPGG